MTYFIAKTFCRRLVTPAPPLIVVKSSETRKQSLNHGDCCENTVSCSGTRIRQLFLRRCAIQKTPLSSWRFVAAASIRRAWGSARWWFELPLHQRFANHAQKPCITSWANYKRVIISNCTWNCKYEAKKSENATTATVPRHTVKVLGRNILAKVFRWRYNEDASHTDSSWKAKCSQHEPRSFSMRHVLYEKPYEDERPGIRPPEKLENSHLASMFTFSKGKDQSKCRVGSEEIVDRILVRSKQKKRPSASDMFLKKFFGDCFSKGILSLLCYHHPQLIGWELLKLKTNSGKLVENDSREKDSVTYASRTGLRE